MKRIVPILVFMVALTAFGQHSDPHAGGKIFDRPAKAKPASTRKARRTTTKPFTTPCGVYYKNKQAAFDELFDTEEWRGVADSNISTWYYNTKNISCDAVTGVLTVQVKSEDKYSTDVLAYGLTKYELKCPLRKYRMISFADYDARGNVAVKSSNDSEPKPWEDAPPESMIDLLMRAVCH